RLVIIKPSLPKLDNVASGAGFPFLSRKPVPIWGQSRNARRSWRVRSRVAQWAHGQFEVYKIANIKIAVGELFRRVWLDWQLGGGGSIAFMDRSSQVAQLVQAMAGFGG